MMESIRKRIENTLATAGLIALFIFCLGLAAPRKASAQDTPQEPLPVTQSQFSDWFESVAQLVQDRFYDPTFNAHDWSKIASETSEKIKLAESVTSATDTINEALQQLQTSHTVFYTSEDVDYYFLLDIFSSGPAGDEIRARFPMGYVSFVGIGIFTKKVDGEWFIENVVDGGPGAIAGLRRGMKIVSVNDQPFSPVGSFANEIGKPTTISVMTTADGEPQSIVVTPCEIHPQNFLLDAMVKSMRLVPVGDKSVGYVRIWSYAGEQFHHQLKQALFGGELEDADALIIDLRDGWGGASPEYLNLFNRQVPQLRMRTRERDDLYFDSQWRKPVCILVNGGTKSGKEVLAYGFKKHGFGKIVGARTAGAVVGGSPFLIGKEAVLYLAVSGIEVDGEMLEGIGIEPDVTVEFPLPFCAAEDPQLSQAIELMAAELAEEK